MAVIQPCHWCGRAVTSATAAYFGHEVCCSNPDCQAQKREMDKREQDALDRMAARERD